MSDSKDIEKSAKADVGTETPRVAGYSRKFVFLMSGVGLIAVFLVVNSLHRKYQEQQAQEHPKQGVVSGAMSDVMEGLSRQSSGKRKPGKLGDKSSDHEEVPTDLANPPSRDSLITLATRSHTQSGGTLDTDKAASSPIVIKAEADYDPAKTAKGSERPGNPRDQKEIVHQIMSEMGPSVAPPSQPVMPTTADITRAVSEGTTNAGGGAPPVQGSSGLAMTPFGLGMSIPGGTQSTSPSPGKVVADEVKFQKNSAKDGKNVQETADLAHPSTPYFLTPGTMIPAILKREINTDHPGLAEAEVSHDVYNDAPGHEGEIIIPEGSKLQGKYNANVQFGQTRVQTAWTTLTYPDGTTLDLSGSEGDAMSGASGLKDQTDNHYTKMFGAAILMSVFTAGPMLATPGGTSSPMTGSPVASMMGESLGFGVSEAGMQFLGQYMNVKPTNTIRAGMPFYVTISKEVSFPNAYGYVGVAGRDDDR